MKQGKTGRIVRNLVLGLGVCTALTGCTAAVAYLSSSKYGFFSGEDINLIEINYAAADYMIGQARSSINQNTLILIGTLSRSQNPSITSEFGKLIPEQVGARMSQLGYHVKIAPPDNGLSEPEKRRHALLTGNYIPSETNSEVTINLRLIDSETRQIMASHDYFLPINEEIHELLEPKPAIVRINH